MKYTESDILAFVEGQMSDAETADFMVELRNNTELSNIVDVMQASMQAIADAYKVNSVQPVPEALRDRVAAMTMAAKKEQEAESESVNVEAPVAKPAHRSAWNTQAALAACLIGGVCVGALLTTLYVQRNLNDAVLSTSLSASSSAINDHSRLVQRIADYQSLYIEKTVETISDSRVDDAKRLLESISERAGMQTAIPDFSSYGYEFARAQELGFEGQTLVQLVYRKPGASPLAFCYMQGADELVQAINLERHHQLNGASWIDNNQHFVLLADESNHLIEQMHETALEAF